MLLCSFSFQAPVKYGDGWEYLGMTISLANHWSPELRATDVAERRIVVDQWPGDFWRLPPSLDYAGYYESKNGSLYCYHFWLYSAFCVLPYQILTYLGINPLHVFQITNSLLMLGLLLWLFYRFKGPYLTKIWLFLAVFISPVLFYISWSHPEVFIYTLFLMGLLDFLNGRYLTGTLMTAIASTQAPPLLIVCGSMFIYSLVLIVSKRQQITSSTIIILSSAAFFVCLPYAFYWLNFGKLSLITGSFAGISAISFAKIISLFIDPNFGLILYVPLLVFSYIWLLFKRKPAALIGVLFLAVTALISTTTINWNAGMMYIHRYAIWLLPLLVVVTLGYFDRLPQKQLIICMVLWLCTTGVVTAMCLRQSDEGNYLKFGSVAKAILASAPAMYNPPYEVFAERALGRDYNSAYEILTEKNLGQYEPWFDRLPLAVVSAGEIRKELTLNTETGELAYKNGSVHLDSGSNLRVFQANSPSDIAHLDAASISWGPGWYSLEQGNQNQEQRWMGNSSEFDFIPSEGTGLSEVNITLLSFYQPRLCTIIVNGTQYFQGVITTSAQEVSFQLKLFPGINNLKIVADSSGVPAEIKGSNSNDTRQLSFMVTELSIRGKQH
jgi:hypothetical protein